MERNGDEHDGPPWIIRSCRSERRFLRSHYFQLYSHRQRCATKAAIHSYTRSLRYQPRTSTTEVLELIPPYVATDLLHGASDPRAMPLDKDIAEVMEILKTQPAVMEICVENVKRLRLAAERGQHDAVFEGLNQAMASGAAS